MSWQGVFRRAHQSCFVVLIFVNVHVSKHKRGDRNQQHQHPHAKDHPPHNLLAGQDARLPRKHHGHQPVDAHQRDQEDGGVHVGVAQVEQAFTHGVTKDPRLLGKVDNEEDGERHEEAVGTSQVKDEEGGDRASPDACQDAPDDEEVTRDAQEEDQAEDEGT